MIRNATYHDLSVVLTIGKRILELSPTYPVTMDDTKASKLFRRSINDRNMATFVAEVDGKVVGFVIGMCEEHVFSRDLYVTDVAFCVLPEHRDQAVWLLRRLIRWSNSFTKVKSIILGISSGMDEGGTLGQLYENHGAKRAGGIHIKLTQRGEV